MDGEVDQATVPAAGTPAFQADALSRHQSSPPNSQGHGAAAAVVGGCSCGCCAVKDYSATSIPQIDQDGRTPAAGQCAWLPMLSRKSKNQGTRGVHACNAVKQIGRRSDQGSHADTREPTGCAVTGRGGRTYANRPSTTPMMCSRYSNAVWLLWTSPFRFLLFQVRAKLSLQDHISSRRKLQRSLCSSRRSCPPLLPGTRRLNRSCRRRQPRS